MMLRAHSVGTSSGRRQVARHGAGWSVATEQKYPVLLEYVKASFERIKQRLGHPRALARVKRVLNGYTLGSNLDRQFGDLPVGLRKILLSILHGLALRPPHFHLKSVADLCLHANELLSARSPTLEPDATAYSKTYIELNDGHEP
jgi:hypothetical protein